MIFLDNSVFLRFPKTGSTCLYECLTEMGYQQKKTIHSPTIKIETAHDVPEFYSNFETKYNYVNHTHPNIFFFVRHPLDWYRSFWRFYKQEERDMLTIWKYRGIPGVHIPSLFNEIFSTCWHTSFTVYIDNICRHGFNYGEGYMSTMARHFDKYATDIGRFENLFDELVRLLTKFGENYDPVVLERYRNKKIKSSNNFPVKYTKQQAEYIMKIDRQYCERFCYNYMLEKVIQ